MKKSIYTITMLAGLAGVTSAPQAAPLFDNGIPDSWSCTGQCGSASADGVVTLANGGGSKYAWISTANSNSKVGLTGVGGTGTAQSGSVLRSNLFSAQANEQLDFSFNFVTSDGAGFADYAWARLLDAANAEVALLFTARTVETGSVVPGVNMPAPNVSLNPTNVPIIAGAPSWFALGGDSGTCYRDGCGYTGWIKSSFILPTAGNFFLEFGVTNWDDDSYDSGMAIDGVTIGGRVINNPVSAPAGFALFALSVLGLLARRRK